MRSVNVRAIAAALSTMAAGGVVEIKRPRVEPPALPELSRGAMSKSRGRLGTTYKSRGGRRVRKDATRKAMAKESRRVNHWQDK